MNPQSAIGWPSPSACQLHRGPRVRGLREDRGRLPGFASKRVPKGQVPPGGSVMVESARRVPGVTVGRGTWVLRAVLCWAGLAGGFAVGVWEGPARGQEDRKGPGRRPQRLALTPEQELELGRQAYRKALQEAGREVLPPDSPEAKRVRRI